MNLYIVLLYSDSLKNFIEVAILFKMKNTQESLGMFMGDNRCTYQMIQKELNTLDPQPYTKLFMKNYV
ncbi:UNVERIFIED_CONTAM: hypothetical protein NCL1_35553 [Trichonephila clavipes]